MDFTFSEDQLLFQESVRDFLVNEITPEKIRELWETDSGRSPELWSQLAELGLTGITVPEDFGGLGMHMLDFVLLAQECGYVALPAPLVHTAMVAVPLIVNSANDNLQQTWLPKIASGEAVVMVGLEQNIFVEDAHIADLLILEKAGALYAVEPGNATLRANESVDLSRKLFVVEFDEAKADKIAEGDAAQSLIDAALNGGALGVAAEALGLAQRMVDISVQYTSERKQFGVAIGTFQAVKHHMANIAYRLEYAKAPAARAAYAIDHGQDKIAMAVSHVKLAASEVANLAAKNCIQVHGAMGYTWEVDLHIYMKRAWAYASTWGDAAFHKQRVADYVLANDAKLGAGNTF
ncbi:alkylation response protein AidB-like acyl-CoA dehydrogenase [Litorivivens lipolytica]|uniref:Alkylation response protein AidB-like acyl-CoA dehydrogenase n=1 Tax=Litorivivens lipolytica TaxID=1524264 RepID=A0A7W4W5W6_9GAMM|nr:acyl-CoA dehydrogenase family protein [Litorivivens lipolytica]MBB3048009.1 alkylation response protein AidB-like acyl-CoA dehydrogenase [Litorivivens lipolytica]